MKFLRSKIEKVLQTDLCMNLRNSHESAVQRERMIESKRRDLQDFLLNDRLSRMPEIDFQDFPYFQNSAQQATLVLSGYDRSRIGAP
jgi:hypothetical protein